MMQLVQLRTQMHRTPGLLPADQAAALDWLCDHNIGGRHDYYDGQNGVAPALLTRLLERVTTMPFVAWRDHLPWISRPAPACTAARRSVSVPELVRLLPMCVTRDDEVWVELGSSGRTGASGGSTRRSISAIPAAGRHRGG